MAIQNFLSGGYYGKLGATVGQRWKNKRTIRTYVVPANPRTPTQQANRGKFADAVTYAQMGMQMNYYCTLFDDPNFTKWNYRMKVARELKNAGLSGLDLIPLYPISFNPPVLLTEFTKATVTGQRHISFAAPDLALNADRVLSLMFALYDEQDTFLGYKLYLGYYYASNPGYVEVDVDDVSEINEHCFVRIISNDDEDSSTDLIGSPRLAIGSSGPEVRDFNTAIRSIAKTSAGIVITFMEPWKGVPTVNTITVTASFVSNGTIDTATLTNGSLSENNGYCSCLIPYATSDNQHLPAFPSGSQIVVSSVDYEGASWQYTKEDDTQAYSDSDLTRSLNTPSNVNGTYGIGLQYTLNYSGADVSIGNGNAKTHYWYGTTPTETAAYTAKSDGNGKLLVEGNISGRTLPMLSGDTVSVPAFSVTSNGVTYTDVAKSNLAFTNSVREITWLSDIWNTSENFVCSWSENGNEDPTDFYAPLNENMLPNEYVEDLIDNINSPIVFEVKRSALGYFRMPLNFTSCKFWLYRDNTGEVPYLMGSGYYPIESGEAGVYGIAYGDDVYVEKNGIKYNFPTTSTRWDNITNM